MSCFNNLPFKFRIFFSFLLVALAPLLLCSFLMVRLFDITLERQAVIEGERQVNEISNRVEELFHSCKNACEMLCEDGSAANVMIDNTTIDIQKDIYLSMYQAVQDVYSYVNFNLYDVGGHLKFSTDNTPILTSLPVHWGLLKKSAGSNDIVYYGTDPYLKEDNDILMQTAYSIENLHGARMGYVVVDFTQTSFDRLLDGLYSNKNTLIILDSQLNFVYSSRADYNQAFISKLQSQIYSNDNSSAKSTEGFHYQWTKEPLSGYYILLEKTTEISTNTIKTMQTISLLAAILCMFLCLIISLIFSQSMAKPISKLADAMEKVKSGNLSIRILTKRKDELGLLTNSFNQMTADLDEYIRHSVQRQKDLNEIRLTLYQTQLNPHFLYNTLDTIKWTAKLHNLPDIASLSENLAFILRRSISDKPFITLQKELETIDSYIGIQKIRFSGRFYYEKEIPEFLEDCLLPKLILQPLVENSILHGLADQDNGYICIYGNQIDDNLHISVSDDGCGIKQDMIDWLNSLNPQKQDGHLGLFNIIQILKLYYGNEYGLKASTNQNGGTTITVILPLRKEPS